MSISGALLLDRLLVGYSYLPHHPGKGTLYERLMPSVKRTWVKPRVRRRFGVSFECDLSDQVDREIYYTGFDRRDCRTLRGLVRPGFVIIDAGANIGYFSLLCAKWISGGVVHAFEPFPTTVRRFGRNLVLNPSLQSVVRLHRVALSDFPGEMGMTVPDDSNQGCNYLSPVGEQKVPVTTIDRFCEQQGLTRLDLIKIDVEGSEIALLRGAEQTIRRFRPILMTEMNASTLRNFGWTPADLLEAICRHGYRLHYAGRFVGLKLLRHLPAAGEQPNIFAFPIN